MPAGNSGLMPKLPRSGLPVKPDFPRYYLCRSSSAPGLPVNLISFALTGNFFAELIMPKLPCSGYQNLIFCLVFDLCRSSVPGLPQNQFLCPLRVLYAEAPASSATRKSLISFCPMGNSGLPLSIPAGVKVSKPTFRRPDTLIISILLSSLLSALYLLSSAFYLLSICSIRSQSAFTVRSYPPYADTAGRRGCSSSRSGT